MAGVLTGWRPSGPVVSLTVMRPWAWCMTDISVDQHGVEPKRLENRTYRPPAALIKNGLLALNNGKTVDRAGAAHLFHELGVLIPDQPLGVVAVCRCTGYSQHAAAAPPGQEFWFCGPNAWKLTEFAVLARPLAMVGHRGYRVVEPVLARALRGEWLRAEREGRLIE